FYIGLTSMSWNSFGNFMSARSSALAEFGNMVANLVSAKNEKDISKRNEYYKQAGYSALLAFGNLARACPQFNLA
ncbi:hypothetical protein, partial [Neisseria meningitidis]